MLEILFSLNGRIVPEAHAVVSVRDRGFLYGDALFETIHAYGPTPFRLKDHLARMTRGFRFLAFRPAPAPRVLSRWVHSAIQAADFTEANVRLTVTRGRGPRGPALPVPCEPLVVIMVTKHQRRPEREYRRGVAAVIASFRRQESGVLARLKTTNYLEQILARREADAAGVDEALLLNSAGLLCEGSASNLTLVKAGRLVAPDPELAGALPGTAQLLVLQLGRKLKLETSLTALGPWDLRECEEAFLTGSMREITPLVRVDGVAIGSGKPGPVTRRLLVAYRQQVARECPGYRST